LAWPAGQAERKFDRIFSFTRCVRLKIIANLQLKFWHYGRKIFD